MKKKSVVLSTMTIVRKGEVLASVEVGSNHCGAAGAIVVRGDENLIAMKYECEVTCRPVKDIRGFLFDQVELDKWIQEYFGDTLIDVSCEELVERLSEEILEKLRTHSPTCKVKRLCFRLSPAPYAAHVEVVYE